MGPKPIITFHDDSGKTLNSVMQKRLKARLKQLQCDSQLKDDSAGNSFSTICNGIQFVSFLSQQTDTKRNILQKPLLHTFWTDTSDVSEYCLRTKGQIAKWLADVEKLGNCAECLIVYCVTADVRAAKKKNKGSADVEDKIKSDFKTKPIFEFRLASSDENRLVESFQTLSSTLNQMCFLCMKQLIKNEAEQLHTLNLDVVHGYSYLARLVELAVACEMILQDEQALEYYNNASNFLDDTLSMHCRNNQFVDWLGSILSRPCIMWDFPPLVQPANSWKYLPAIQDGSASLLDIHTFIFARQSKLRFALDKGWDVSQDCINTLHMVSKEQTFLKLNLPTGAFECWAYMTCLEAVLAIMTQSKPDSLMSAASSILVRAELWHYALEKLHSLGIMCGLMPGNVKNVALVSVIESGLSIETQVEASSLTESHGLNMRKILQSQQEFNRAYLTLGEMVIGAYKHAGRKRMAFRVGTMMAQFHRDLKLWKEAEQLLSDVCNYYSEEHWSHLFINAYSVLADCQQKLKMEDKCVATMLLLASAPPCPKVNHDPVVWMDKVLQVARKSVYQKLLNWEPIMELVKIVVKSSEVACDDDITVEVHLQYKGPKNMRVNVASLTYCAIPKLPFKELSKRDLEELNLDSLTEASTYSRPIGITNKRYRTIDSSVVNTPGDSKQNTTDLCLTARQELLHPGYNQLSLFGKAVIPGQYFATKISLKCDSLDFILLLNEGGDDAVITVEPHKPPLSVTFSCETRVFLGGYPSGCTITLKTRAGTKIPANSSLRVVLSEGCSLQATTSTSIVKQESAVELSYNLPEVISDTCFACPLNIIAPWSCLGTEACIPLQEVKIFCEWLEPVHVVRFPISVEQPFIVTCTQHACDEVSYLLLSVINTSSIPLEFCDFVLSSKMAFICIHDKLSSVLCPGNTLSNIWQSCATEEASTPELSTISFNFRPALQGDNAYNFQSVKHPFQLTAMQVEYRISLEVSRDSEYSVNKTVPLTFYIESVTEKKMADALQYKILTDTALWKIEENESGSVIAPDFGEKVSLSVKVIPKVSGCFQVPTIVLSIGAVELTELQVYNRSLYETVNIL